MSKPYKPFIPAASSPTMEKFINTMMEGGKKSVARRVFAEALAVIRTRTKEAPTDVFQKALVNVSPMAEVRPRRVGGAVYQVPVEVSPKRQQALSMRWLITAARARKGVPMAQKLALELLDASTEQGAAFKKKEDVIKMAHANKAFAHLAKNA